MRFKSAALTLITAAVLASGCSQSSTMPLAVGPDAGAMQAHGVTAADAAMLEATVETLAARYFADEAADPAWEGEASERIGPRGGILYRMLAGSATLRKWGYKLAERPVHKHFSKPSQQDKVPPLSPQERQELAALLQPGDIIQCGNNGSFVHAIFYEGEGMIVHALAQSGFGKKMIGVRREPMSEYLDRSDRDTMVVLRPTYSPEQLQAAIAYARAQEGKGYDTLFMTDSDDRQYCTELAYNTLIKSGAARVEPHLASKAKWRLITNEDLRRSPDLQVVYRRNHD